MSACHGIATSASIFPPALTRARRWGSRNVQKTSSPRVQCALVLIDGGTLNSSRRQALNQGSTLPALPLRTATPGDRPGAGNRSRFIYLGVYNIAADEPHMPPAVIIQCSSACAIGRLRYARAA